MSTRARGHLVLDHPIEAITIGGSHRTDLGDLSELRESITKFGLLSPITISVDHALISGRRRLEAMRQMGHTSVPIWIAAGVSDQLRTLLAIQDEQSLRKQYTPTEQARLYAEMKELLAQEAARRQQATRFGAIGDQENEGEGHGDGGWESQPPLPRRKRKSRIQAAEAITGRDSSQQHEQVLELGRIAAEEGEDPRVRAAAAEALVGIDTDRQVHGHYLEVKNLQAAAWLEAVAADPGQPEAVRHAAGREAADLELIAHPGRRAGEAARAVARIRRLQDNTEEPGPDPTHEAYSLQRLQCEQIAAAVAREPGWWQRAEAETIGRYASDSEWKLIHDHLRAAETFLEAARTSRASRRATSSRAT